MVGCLPVGPPHDHLLVVGGIASVHDVARRLGAELTLVKTAAAQTMLSQPMHTRGSSMSPITGTVTVPVWHAR